MKTFVIIVLSFIITYGMYNVRSLKQEIKDNKVTITTLESNKKDLEENQSGLLRKISDLDNKNSNLTIKLENLKTKINEDYLNSIIEIRTNTANSLHNLIMSH